MDFLSLKQGKISGEAGNEMRLRGINLGGWLMMEGYIVGGRNIPERRFTEKFKEKNGPEALDEFYRRFRDSFISKKDIAIISDMKFNCVRLPFHYKIILNNNISYIDRLLDWCRAEGLYCILDMHALPGSQNGQWHSDGENEKPGFWGNEEHLKEYLRMWDFISMRYSDRPEVAAYNIMNEPVLKENAEQNILPVYKKVSETIRKNDRAHMIMVEGNLWSTDISFLGKPEDGNTFYSVHFYEPLDFTFNLNSSLTYPGMAKGVMWNRERMFKRFEKYSRLISKWNVPLLVGEFGVNAQCMSRGGKEWLKDVLDVFETLNFHWTYWTYKTIPVYMFPDGLYIFNPNPLWISRHDSESGWEMWAKTWEDYRGEIIKNLDTSKFSLNKTIAGFFQG